MKTQSIKSQSRSKFISVLLLLAATSVYGANAQAPSQDATSQNDNFFILSRVESMLCFAETFCDTKYQYGGCTPDGFDCSGFVNYVFCQMGVVLPRSSPEMFNTSNEVDLDHIQAGDLIFFGNKNHIFHVAIVESVYNGSVQVIHASSSQGVSKTNITDSAYWRSKMYKAMRVELPEHNNF